MNQILSVDLPQNNNNNYNNYRKKQKSGSKKASTKSVIIVFCIILLIFGLAMAALGVYSFIKNKDGNSVVASEDDTNKPRIDIINSGVNSIDISVTSENSTIVKIEYNWNGNEPKEVTFTGQNPTETVNDVIIPNGTNTLYVVATDANGVVRDDFNKEFTIDAKEPNVTLDQDGNKLKIILNEQNVSQVGYYLDNEQEQLIAPTNNEVLIEKVQGKHTLTIREIYSDGTTSSLLSKSIFIPVIDKPAVENGNIVIRVSDESEKGIQKVTINYNGEITEEANINSPNYEKALTPKDGENQSIVVIVLNNDGLSYERPFVRK